MSYLRRLDQARTHLGDGDLLAAERELREATRIWRESRVRAPLVEKGLEPALRTLGKMFGRRSNEPVLPVFARRADLLREDLQAYARALAAEVLEDVAREGLDAGARHEQVTEALTLQRSSEFFDLLPSREWELVRVWLEDGRKLGAGVRAELLPVGPPPLPDEEWWLDWFDQWCADPTEPVRAFADWGRHLARAYQGAGTGRPARWAWIEARLALLDPLAAPAGRAPVERVIECGGAEGLVGPALHCWAELVTNSRFLASSGGNARDLLEQRSMQAARAGVEWPPPGILERLAERRPTSGAPAFVAVHWQDDAAAVSFVLHDGRSAIDVLCIRPALEPDPVDPFAMDPPEAQRRIASWIPPDAILLSAREPGPGLRGLVGSARWIPVQSILDLFGCEDLDRAPAVAGTEHPAWTREICGPWDLLVPAARRLIPMLEGLFSAWPSLATPWGRDNLRRIGMRGVSLAGALADAAELVAADPYPAPVLETAPPLQLVWPSLEHRPWPGAGIDPPAGAHSIEVGHGHEWIERRASAEELAAAARQQGGANILCVGESRAFDLASAAASVVDPSKVAVVGPNTPCAGPLLELLNRWVTESPGDLDRGRAAIWLLAVLSESVGPLGPLLARSGDPGLVAEVQEVLQPCTERCESHPGGECWPVQATVRVEQSRVAVVEVDCEAVIVPPARCTIADDLRQWVADVADDVAMRRLRHLPSAPQPVTVFTPGVSFMVDLLGGIPSLDGGDSDWSFTPDPERTGPSLWTAPPGYAARCVLLARESRSLVEERARRWWSDAGEAPLWGQDLGDAVAALRGVATEPTADTILIPALGAPDLTSPLLAGLRLAAAASHARRRVVCLSPTFAEVFRLGGGLVHGDDEPALPRALDSGAVLLSARRGRMPATWASPITRPRLELVGAVHGRELSARLSRWIPARGRVLAGVLERDRDAIIELICRLQSEALDGGPLGVRSVVEVVAGQTGDDSRPLARLRTLDRGRRQRVRMGVDELGASGVEDWARRNPSVAWVFRHAEALLDSGRHDAATRMLAALRRSHARTLFFCDHAVEARRVRELASPHVPVDPVAVVEDYPAALESASWSTRTLGALDVNCPECGRAIQYVAAYSLCPDCGIPVDGVASVRRMLRLLFEGRVVDALGQLGPQAGWTMIVFDPGRRSRLRQRLGLGAVRTEEAPLLRQAERSASARILLPEDLWPGEPLAEPVIVCGLPDALSTWVRVAGRLRALGAGPGQWWLGPPGLDETELLPAAEADFSISRREFLRGLAAERGDPVASNALERLEAAGGGWSQTARLRVHELTRPETPEDASLAALLQAHRKGWLREGAVSGVGCVVPAALERAIRTGQRLKIEDSTASDGDRVVEGRLVGIAGCGKTTALTHAVRRARDEGESVLVLVPHSYARLQWIGRLKDPTVCCLHLDECLLDFVGAVSRDPVRAERLKVLPPADRGRGEEVRLELVRIASRFYEQECGELPAVDGRTLLRALEGERSVIDAGAVDHGIQVEVLMRSIDRARREGGWTDSRELVERAREVAEASPDRAALWAERFDAVFVDDAHDVAEEALEFLRDLFASRLRAVALDPVLGLTPDSDLDHASMQSWRFGPAIAEAIEAVWRSTTPLPARVKGRGPAKGTVESERILALGAAIERFAAELADLDGSEEVAVVAASERDRRLLEHQLGLRSIPVRSGDPDPVGLVTGPREILAALAWVSGVQSDASTDLLGIVLGAGPEPSERDNAEHYEARMRRRLAAESVEILDRVEAFLLPLVLIRGALGPATSVDRAVEVLLGCGLVHRLEGQPAIARRIGEFVRQHRGTTVTELLESTEVERILDPASGRGCHVLAPDQLAGRSFDRIYYVCTGFEPPERHYRVLSRARQAVRIACSEVDPLQG